MKAVNVSFDNLSASDIGRAFNVTRQAVGGWHKNGCPRNSDGTYRLAAVVEWFCDRESGALAGGRSEALERYRTAKAKQAELELAKMEGELVELAVVDAYWCDRAAYAKAVIASVPAGAGALVGQDAPHIGIILEDKLRGALTLISEDWKKPIMGNPGFNHLRGVKSDEVDDEA